MDSDPAHSRLRRLLALAALSAGGTLAIFGALFALHLAPAGDRGLVRLVPVERGLEQIRAEGTLRVAAVRDDVAWTTRRGVPEGLARELVEAYAFLEGFELEVLPVSTKARALRDLLAGRVDLVVSARTAAEPPLTPVAWSAPLAHEHPVLIGREADSISDVEELRGRTVAVRRHSAHERLARRWKAQLGGELELVRLPAQFSERQYALLAARGAYELVLMDERRARLEAAVYAPLEVSAPLAPPEPVRWALRPNAPRLLESVSDFLSNSRREGAIAELERRYLENPERLKARRRPPFRERGPELSPYDGLFRAAGDRHGFDWRLLAALSFAESGYSPYAVSSAGAMGLLQIMPSVAQQHGAEDPWDPRQNVAAGARHLRWLYNLLDEVESEHDRLAFALASYNMGLGHLHDARGLAALRGLDPDRWRGHVAEVLPLLEVQNVYENLTHGFARGRMTRAYVEEVLGTYALFTRDDLQAMAVRPPVSTR